MITFPAPIARRAAYLVLLALACVTASSPALATVRREGAWPEHEKLVTLDLTGVSRAEALRKLADEAGWAFASQLPQEASLRDVHAVQKPADQVLALILSDGDFVAVREGDSVSVRAALPSAATTGEAKSADDRVVTASSVTIAKGEVVHDITVIGGALSVYGTITGNLVILGGAATLHEGARVAGSATTFGGALTIERGAHVEGKASVVGGSLKNDSDSGSVTDSSGDEESEGVQPQAPKGFAARAFDAVGSALSNASACFLFGAMLLALARSRMEALQTELVLRPMRCASLGFLALVGGTLLLIALCITLIGAPVAIVGVFALIFAAFAGTCAGLATIGGMFLNSHTRNVYAHLALGCALFVVVGAMPWVGGFAQMAIVLAGLGAVATTRAAGLVKARSRSSPASVEQSDLG